MKILFISDDYAKNVAGTKISIFNEMKRRGHDLTWLDKNFLIKYKYNLLEKFKNLIVNNFYEQLWLVHSSLVISKEVKDYLYSKNVPVIGFGMSDPYYFDHKKRFFSYDIYVSNSFLVSGKYRSLIPTIYNPTACDFTFHKDIKSKKQYPTSIIGRGKHPRFTDEDMRHIDIDFLRKNGIVVHTFGKDWGNKHKHGHNPVVGIEFLNVINDTMLGLDLQDTFSPLAHRMMEYSACGTPIITRLRDEVKLHFEEDKEILFYNSREELLSKVKYYLKHYELLKVIGQNAKIRCKKDHNITNRVDNIINGINNIIGKKVL